MKLIACSLLLWTVFERCICAPSQYYNPNGTASGGTIPIPINYDQTYPTSGKDTGPLTSEQKEKKELIFTPLPKKDMDTPSITIQKDIVRSTPVPEQPSPQQTFNFPPHNYLPLQPYLVLQFFFPQSLQHQQYPGIPRYFPTQQDFSVPNYFPPCLNYNHGFQPLQK